MCDRSHEAGGLNLLRETFRAALLALAVMLSENAGAQIAADGRTGRVGPFRSEQSTFMFQWDISAEDYLQKGWLDQPQALGPMFGFRPWALEHGVTLAGTYTGSVMGAVLGGKSQGAAYMDVLFMSAILDLGELIGLDGWSISISARQTDGSFIADIVGSTPLMSPVSEANRSFRLGQLSLSWEGFDDKVQVSAGRLVLNNTFAHIPQASLFLNASMNGYPGAISNDVTFTGTNSARWGALANVQPVEYAYFLAGVFSADTSLEINSAHGCDFSMRPRSGTIEIMELGLYTGTYNVAPDGKATASPGSGPETWLGGKPGAYKIGGIISTAAYDDFQSGGQVWGNWGMYATASQMVYREPGGVGGQEGLTLFGSVTYFPPDRNYVPWFFMGGAFYQGLIPGRERDQCGVAFSCAFFSDDLRQMEQSAGNPGPTNEMALEFTYSFSITPWAYVSPDLQVLVNPGATGANPTAVVIGFETGITF
ncbi:MAG: hypothetical protein BGO12_17105 [Verrucomicrobia bacterium 61-8]|nr:carbohydrate porin [Verrucomicrobiota bacterium]OJV06599.1 MAG: hypothetical protein BGO12_17105 [Verrucomicrobia bacterium 61-8]